MWNKGLFRAWIDHLRKFKNDYLLFLIWVEKFILKYTFKIHFSFQHWRPFPINEFSSHHKYLIQEIEQDSKF